MAVTPSKMDFARPAGEDGSEDDEVVVLPVALNVLSAALAELINHAYKCTDFYVEPSMDESDQYGLYISMDDLEPGRKQNIIKILEDIEALGHMSYDRELSVIFCNHIDALLDTYKGIAQAYNIPLDGEFAEHIVEGYTPGDKEKHDQLMGYIVDSPESLLYLHKDQGYVGTEHLLSCFLKATMAYDEGNYVPTYTLSQLETVCSSFNLKREQMPGSYARWVN